MFLFFQEDFMNFNDLKVAVETCLLKKYADFSGRATRSEYWYFALCYFVVSTIISAIDKVIPALNGIPSMIFSLALLVPTLSVGVRRMHDANKSGWFILIPLYNIYLLVQPSVTENNKY